MKTFSQTHFSLPSFSQIHFFFFFKSSQNKAKEASARQAEASARQAEASAGGGSAHAEEEEHGGVGSGGRGRTRRRRLWPHSTIASDLPSHRRTLSEPNLSPPHLNEPFGQTPPQISKPSFRVLNPLKHETIEPLACREDERE